MSKKLKNHEPCVYQLHNTEQSLSLIRDLAIIIRRCFHLNCLPYELHTIIEAIIYEYVNNNLDSFFDSVIQNGNHYNVQIEILKNIVSYRVSSFKKGFSSYVYQFPVSIFNLDGELKLSDSIRLVPIDPMDITEQELTLFNETRTFDCNYYIEVYVKTKCSNKLALQQAEKARDATYNILKLLATRLSPRAIPLLTSTDRVIHPLHFYRYGKNRGNISNVITRNFPTFQFDSNFFWAEFHKGHSINGSLISISLRIVELLLIPNFSSERVVDRLERALLWYGDAVTECIFYQKIQKLVSSMEALINFRDDDAGDITETFKRRITHLNITHAGLNDDVKEKARQLYDARSKIVHGSSIDERFTFCIIELCSETLLRAIYYFSLFGFEKTGFNRTLPKFLDEIPTNAVLKNNS
ncbi:HEPN domain-containing protein [Pectobacterium polaris]|uniref:HEPN domain-containing protein n=1 Tax=Pectobacterium polaris TaxID=2042057 RepID=UPI0020C60252|nr:HEPN domain-containing protein [Pectobacterium polaris]